MIYYWVIEDEVYSGDVSDFIRNVEGCHYAGIHMDNTQVWRVIVQDGDNAPVFVPVPVHWGASSQSDDYLYSRVSIEGNIGESRIDLRA